MIDFQNAVFLKLRPVADNTFSPVIQPMFIPGEEILCSFQTVRDGVVFTNKRIFAINVQGITGKKKDFTSLPYSKIQALPAWARSSLSSSAARMSPASAGSSPASCCNKSFL